MKGRHFQWYAGGTGNWGRPVHVDAGTLKVGYEGLLGNRLVFDNGQTAHLRTRFVGIDVIGIDGRFPSDAGFGEIEGRDADGDWLLGHVDWEVPVDQPQGESSAQRASGTGIGHFRFTSGTGKWEGAHGAARGALWFIFEQWEVSAPPEFPLTRPVRVYAFLDAEGELEVPHLGQ